MGMLASSVPPGEAPQLPEEDGPQHEKRCQKAKGVQGQRLQLRQAQVQQVVGHSPECGGQYQQQIRFTLPAHIFIPPVQHIAYGTLYHTFSPVKSTISIAAATRCHGAA